MDMDLSEVTPFRRRVYEALLEVPEGEVITYKELGERIGCRSSQAIGQALKHNPFAKEIPCHRVVKSNLSLGGYFGESEGRLVEEKMQLLRSEGVHINDEGKIVR